jgi:hypothetical protein
MIKVIEPERDRTDVKHGERATRTQPRLAEPSAIYVFE